MVFEELVEAREFDAGHVVVSAPGVFATVKVLFPGHELAWVFFVLFANSGVVGKKLLQRRMILDELLIVDQGRVLAQLFRDLGMAVHEAIHVGKLAAGYVGVPAPGVFAAIKVMFPGHELAWVFFVLFADSGVVGKKLL